jgi:hypothetical protein
MLILKLLLFSVAASGSALVVTITGVFLYFLYLTIKATILADKTFNSEQTIELVKDEVTHNQQVDKKSRLKWFLESYSKGI